jgi:ribonuclease E
VCVVELSTNAEVAALLGVDIEDVEALGDELGIDDDSWRPSDIENAEALLEDEDSEDEDSEDEDESDVEEDDDDDELNELDEEVDDDEDADDS